MMKVRLRVDQEALFHWALQFADAVEIIKPVRLRDRMIEELHRAVERYEGVNDL